MIYLIGVEHGVQSISVDGEETADHTKYRRCLEQAVRLYRPTVVAEEYSDDALSKAKLVKNTQQEFFTRKIARACNVGHLLCDTDRETKCSMGYQGESGWQMLLLNLWTPQPQSDMELLGAALEVLKDFPLRENYWLRRLEHVLLHELVFVCGDYHVDTFGNRLRENGIQSQVVERQIGMPAELIERTERIKAYIQHNSQHIEDVFQEILELHSGQIPPLSFPD
jgi:hypothetical protein